MRRFAFSILLFFGLILPSLGKADPIVHQVRSGETLWSISRQYSVPVKAIVRLNHLRNPRRLDVGQKILIPTKEGTLVVERKELPKETTPILELPYDPPTEDDSLDPYGDLSALCKTQTFRLNEWRYIVIHHSATPNGGARAFDNYHRAKRHMQNGLAYHFVIGNGNGARDGLIEVGPRWKKQVRGGHCSNQKMNDVGIGICLVGNFEQTAPTRKQMAALLALIQYLQKQCGIPDSHVIQHKEVRQKSTLCPGRRFPAAQLRRQLSRD